MEEWKLKGVDDALKRLQSIPEKIRKKSGRAALGAAARVVRRAAKDNAQRVDSSETGRKIADNIVQRFRSRYFKQTGDLMISIGVATERGPIPKGNPDEGPGGNTPHWHLLEFGTERSQAKPFMRPALANNTDAATSAFVNRLNKELDKVGV